MDGPAETIKPIRNQQEKVDGRGFKLPESSLGGPRRDLGKVALFVSLASMILVVIFFFGLNQNISGLNREVGKVSDMNEKLADLNVRFATVEQKMSAIDAVPAEVKRALVTGMLGDLAQRTGRLAGELDSAEQTAKLNQAVQLLQEVQQELSK